MRLALIIAALILVIAVGPLAFIWALDTLFALSIAYTFKTWLAAFLISALVSDKGGVR